MSKPFLDFEFSIAELTEAALLKQSYLLTVSEFSPHKFSISQELVKTAINLRGKLLLNGKGRQSGPVFKRMWKLRVS